MRVLLGIAGIMLAACGGGGGGSAPDVVDPRLDRLDMYDAQRIRVLGDPETGARGMDVTAATALPVSGQTIFFGHATMTIEMAPSFLQLAGDASLTVDFGTNQTLGQIDAVFGTSSSGNVVNYDGSLELTGPMTGSDLAIDYAGTLTSDGTQFGFDGHAAGALMGTPVAAVAVSDLEATVATPTGPHFGTVVVIAEVESDPP